MFVSARDQGRRRRSHIHGVSKAARSSKLSLLSAITTASHGSNDSTSTTTQETYARSSSGSSKRRKSSKSKKPREGREGLVPSVNGTLEKSNKAERMSRESVDVFAFLVKDDDQSTPTLHTEEPAHFVPEETPVHDESETEGGVKSQHSDSGISMGDSSVCHVNNDPSLDSRLSPLPEDTQDITDTQGHLKDRPSYSRRLRWKWPDVPPATHKRSIPSPSIRTPSPEHTRIHTPRTPDSLDKEFCAPKEILSGYDLVADKLTQGEIPPVFRLFQKSNYRVLLQLQDEIGEMEEELAALDLADTRSRLNSNGSTSPASRRINWQWSQSDLQAHRLQVLGRLYIKIEQYYQALLSTQKVQRLSSRAIPAEIDKFRAWLRENNPLSGPESTFLDNEDDLIALKETSTGWDPTGSTSTTTTPDLVPLCILTMTLLPLLCFKLITGVLNRLILLTALLAAGLSGLEKLDRSKGEQQHRQWVLACFGVSFLAALSF
ncbi:uncharacterized protein Z518_09800 [Rhinocladiella mackenziei CBS 650.93]|uniref:DUF6594 domain-containing protein n=1 Tax=Rhinocladiella mackenziei CBS 650.93 TaxID=1442369 RepID=A0A0D2IVK5_9EURO|nr:uncharacterized protein Z518_09800 [Rhinocladiella mackenziei CBS 650.93]KIX00735.1 hypothetical protein Z518_09800 [Rhinocladiella mackenziei CBS 650.93]